MATTASSSLPRNYSFTPPRPPPSSIRGPGTLPLYLRRNRRLALTYRLDQNSKRRSGGNVRCEATEVSSSSSVSTPGRNWVPVVPLSALPKGERRVVIQDDETILLLWYKNDVFAIENRSPAEGAYSEGLLNARLTQDGCIVCPSTDSTFDLRTGEIREWYPKNPVLRVLTPALRKLFVYPVKYDEENIYISIRDSGKTEAAAEIVFSGKAQPGLTATNVNVDEVRMIVDEGSEGFGFTAKNEVINGKAAVIGFLLLLDFELLTVCKTRQDTRQKITFLSFRQT
ncbi:Rieske-like [2Fe-2S] domain NirD-type [Arabidopsis suecica]|uniref:Rieske-like [2Fe-2S] domain NirD-type n=1 Tax=Arabidopsis suecica TaxID=45249 RepID=A0A8T2BQB3_ARASU|nr:Rieske-like [2Fe-2S] domain NirD-type [Arabidopsis suecica]